MGASEKSYGLEKCLNAGRAHLGIFFDKKVITDYPNS